MRENSLKKSHVIFAGVVIMLAVLTLIRKFI